MKRPSRLIRQTSILLICDIQQKFVQRVYGKEGVLQASSMMVRAAKVLGIPVLISEQTRKVMGQTCPEIKKYLSQVDPIIQKTKFSMIFNETIQILDKHSTRKQVILIGMEAQVCIIQTCFDLLQRNYQVFLAVDAITSIRPWQRQIALKRMEKEGAILTTFESSVFDLLKDAKDEKFKDILSIIKLSKRDNAISHL